MISETKSTGRPRQPIWFLSPVVLLVCLLTGVLEILYQVAVRHLSLGALSGHLFFATSTVRRYAHARFWVIAHPVISAVVLAAVIVIVLLGYRSLLIWWHNQVVSRLSGTHFDESAHDRFPTYPVDLLQEIARR